MYLDKFQMVQNNGPKKKKKKKQQQKIERETKMLEFDIFIEGGHLQRLSRLG